MGLISLISLMGLIGLIGLLCGCKGEMTLQPDVPVPNDLVAISFSGVESETEETTRATRAAAALEESATTFQVWAYKNMEYSAGSYTSLQTVMPGYTVNWGANTAATTTSNTNDWEYMGISDQTIKYWDFGAAAYKFFGATNWEAESAGPYEPNKTYGANKTTTYEITMVANCSDDDEDGNLDEAEVIAANMNATPFYTHLWFSTGNVDDYPDKQFGKPVQLEFLKPYTRVRFLFKYSYESEAIKLRKNEFKPTNGSGIARKGTVTISYPLTGSETRESFSSTPNPSPVAGEELEAMTKEYVPDGGPAKEIWYYVLPRHSQGSYTMSVWMNNDNLSDPATRTAVVPAEYMRWLPNYSYTYIFKILEEGGVEIEDVQAAVTPWTEMQIDHTLYNW